MKNYNKFGYTVSNTNERFLNTVVSRIQAIVNRRASREWTGTVSELTAAITSGLRNQDVLSWVPSNPSVMRRVLNTVAPILVQNGYKIAFPKETSRTHKRVISFVKA